MILPATYTSVVILLLASLFCLGTWINTFKATGPKWRWELFSIDFAAGALIVAVAAAYTLGSMGSDLGFGDRLLVAGRTAQVLALLAGGVFTLGAMLLLASVSLIGIAAAFPLSIGVALIVSSSFYIRLANMYYFLAAGLLVLLTFFLELRAARLRDIPATAKQSRTPHTPAVAAENAPSAAVHAPSGTSGLKTSSHRSSRPHSHPGKRKPPTRGSRHAVRGATAGLIAGAALGFFVPLLQNALPGEIGLGPYAGLLLFSIACLVSVIVYDFYFLNVAIAGESLTFKAYFRGTKLQHFLGFLGGAICLAGLLAVTVAVQASGPADVPKWLQFLLPLLSVPLACLYAAVFWKELRVTAQSRFNLLLGLLLFLGSLALYAYGFAVR